MKPTKLLIGIFTAVLAFIALVASAATPLARVLTPSAGAVTYTNVNASVVASIDRILISGIQPNDATVTVSRVSTVRNWNNTNSVVTTNQIATLVCASAVGTSSNIGRVIYYGDKLVFSGVGTNAGTILIEATDPR